MTKLPLDRQRILAVEKIIRPHVRRTPVIAVDAPDFRLDSISLICKLEFLQHAVLDEVTVHLRRKVPARAAQPAQNAQPAFVGKRAKRRIKIHIDN